MNMRNIYKKMGTFLILIILVLIFGLFSPKYFLSLNNLTQILLQSSITILIACGEFFAILIAGIDLSVGSILAFTGLITAKLLVLGFPVFSAILIGGILIGGILGAINGILVNKTGLHPFIITLGTMSIFRGLTLLLSNARPIYGLPLSFTEGISGWIWKVPIPILIAGIFATLLWLLTKYTRFGRNLYAIGGNKKSAWFAGIPVKEHVLAVFIISGIASGLAGVVTTARLGSAEPQAGMGFEVYAIAGAIIGGTSFFGGIGKIPSVVIGGIIIGIINNGLNILNISTFYQQIVMGSLIILAVFLDNFIQNKNSNNIS